MQYSLLIYYRIVNFNMLFSNRGGPGPILDSFDEGVEFGFQTLNYDRKWIPLAFYSFHRPNRRDEDIKLGPELMLNDNITIIRGYNVFIYLVGGTIAHRAELKFCGSEIIQNNTSLSFRWLQTVVSGRFDNIDPAYLDNITISINSPEGHNMTLFDDDFNSEMLIK